MKAYIFDLDGTLLDSTGLWAQIDIDFLAKRGIAVPPDYADAVACCSFAEAAAYTVQRFGLPESTEALQEEWLQMAAEAYSSSVPLKPGARAYLDALRAAGAKMAVATSLSPSLYGLAMHHLNIAAYFDVICSSHEVEGGKTRPDVFLLAARRLGAAPEECIVFEDVPQAVQSAKAAGMQVYAVLDEASRPHWDYLRSVADGALTDFTEAPLPETEE